MKAAGTIKGVLLCGGESRRMGKDKGLLEFGGEKWFIRLARLLNGFFPHVLISIRKDQYSLYKEAIEHGDSPEMVRLRRNVEFVFDNEEIPIKGPVRGILSAHDLNPLSDIFVLGVDYLEMNAKVLQYLLARYLRNDGDSDVYYLHLTEAPEPLCCIYTAPFLLDGIKKNRDGGYIDSAKAWVKDCRHDGSSVPATWRKYFHNYNTVDDCLDD